MKVCHFSDWHWNFQSLPPADLYICSGDMYTNFPVSVSRTEWCIDPERERRLQLIDVEEFVSQGGFHQLLGSPDAPIVCVRGNHDFIDLAPLFGGCNMVHEFIDNELIEVLGRRITGHRGIPRIYGSWNDEFDRSSLLNRVENMQQADIFVTHYPPAGMLDHETMARGRIEKYGLEGMSESLGKKMGHRGLHCFGHVHGCGGMLKETGPGQFDGLAGHMHVYSNAACNINMIEI